MRDVYMIFHGRGNKVISDQALLRNVTAIVSDVFSQVMGGQSVRGAIYEMWKLPGDQETGGREMTREERRELIKRHHLMLEAKKKKE